MVQIKNLSELNIKLPSGSRYLNSQVVIIDGVMSFFRPRYRKIYPDDSDTLYTVKLGQEGRLDQISYDLYRSAKYYWVLAEFNSELVKNPFLDPRVGDRLRAPTINRILRDALGR